MQEWTDRRMGGRVLASRREATCAAAGSTRDSGRPRRGSKAAGRGQGRDGSGSIGAALRASTLTLWSTSCGTYPREGAGPIRALRAGSVYWGGGLGWRGARLGSPEDCHSVAGAAGSQARDEECAVPEKDCVSGWDLVGTAPSQKGCRVTGKGKLKTKEIRQGEKVLQLGTASRR